jgi:hypothetical protein
MTHESEKPSGEVVATTLHNIALEERKRALDYIKAHPDPATLTAEQVSKAANVSRTFAEAVLMNIHWDGGLPPLVDVGRMSPEEALSVVEAQEKARIQDCLYRAKLFRIEPVTVAVAAKITLDAAEDFLANNPQPNPLADRKRAMDFIHANPDPYSLTSDLLAQYTDVSIEVAKAALVGWAEEKAKEEEAKEWEKRVKERTLVVDYLKALPEGQAMSAEEIAMELKVSAVAVRDAMLQVTYAKLGTPTAEPELPVGAAESVVTRPLFVPVPEHPKVAQNESVEDTVERLRKVDNRYVNDFHRRQQRNVSTGQALLGLAEEDLTPSEYLWTPIDHNLECAYVGWKKLSFRVRGKRQLNLVVPLEALRRALAICPEDVLRELEIDLSLDDEDKSLCGRK